MSADKKSKSWIVFLSTFPPRQCGIATFTTDLSDAIDQMFGPLVKSKVVAMNPAKINQLPYHDKVIFQISQSCKEDYIKAAYKLNRLEKVKLVNVQHEFGIFGGEYGNYLLLFLKKLKKPAVVTFHTVLPTPNEKLKKVVKSLAQYSQGIAVMTDQAKEFLKTDYGLELKNIKVIPHGIHSSSYKTSEQAKSAFGYANKLILSTFGLISPNKGIEYVIEALPAVVKKYPQVCYLIAGVTHPNILEQEGEKYRNFLIKKVYQLGLNDYVLFYNTYWNINKLLRFLESTDIYLSPSLDPEQTVSGTLSYALGSGRPVISTAFAQAKQDVTKAIGILVDFKNPQAFTKAIIKLIENKNLSLQMGKKAYFRTRHMTWENVANSYMRYFSKFSPNLILEQKKLPSVRLDHLVKLTDYFGIIQFAKLTEPDLSSGYTLDDNARALIAVTFYYRKFKAKSVLKLISIYLNFIKQVAKPDGYFDNYVNPDRTVNKQRNIQEKSEDANTRALYALALVFSTKTLPKLIKDQAFFLFNESLRKQIAFYSPRSIAFYIKALNCSLLRLKDPKILSELKFYCKKLASFYKKNHSSGWEWFEPFLTYSNATLIEAVLLGYRITKETKYLKVVEKTLNFLISHTFRDKIYIPIGQSGWFFKGGIRQYFDQQPEDVTATVEALNTMFQVTHKKEYKELANIAFNWFLGDNILEQVVYDRTTGGCYDGVGEKFINLNQGAESTISYLLARLSFES
ncbi:MAG: glycosyltransferase [Candidatus Beckwithbacteria bacterium]